MAKSKKESAVIMNDDSSSHLIQSEVKVIKQPLKKQIESRGVL
jgi:hypothetical protein